MLNAFLKPIKSHSGFSLVELLVAGAVLSVSVWGFMAFTSYSLKNRMQSRATSVVSTVRQKLAENINSSGAWRNTIAANSSTACLKNLTDCSTYSSWTDITVMDSDENKLTDATSQGAGFDQTGEVCTSFPSLECPFRYDVAWKAICGTSDCVNPLVQVRAELSSWDGPGAPVINSHRYSLSMIRGQTTNTKEDSCLAANGTYDPVNHTCKLPLVGKCPNPAHVVTGVDPVNFQKTCGPIWHGKCPTNGPPLVLYGTLPDGSPDCRLLTNCWTGPTGPTTQYPTLPAGGDGSDGSCGGGPDNDNDGGDNDCDTDAGGS